MSACARVLLSIVIGPPKDVGGYGIHNIVFIFILVFCFTPLFFGLDKNLKVANEVLMAFCLIVSVKAKGKPEEGGKVKFTAIICGWSQGTQHQVSSDWSKGEVGVIV